MAKNKDKKTKSDLDETSKSSQEEKDLDTSLEEENEVLSELVKSLEEKILRAQAEIENVRKTKLVKPILLSVLPYEMKTINSTKKRKKLFIQIVLTIILEENNRIRLNRKNINLTKYSCI